MPKVTVVLRLDYANAKGEHPVRLRVADGTSTLYKSLKIAVQKKHWLESKAQVRKSHPRHEVLNALIATRLAEAERELYKARTVDPEATAHDVKDALVPAAQAHDFHSFAAYVADDLEARGSYQRAQKIRTVTAKLAAYTPACPPLPFGRITPAMLRGFETHLISHHGNAPNTVRANFNALRSVHYRAIREGLADQGANPYFIFKTVKEQRAERGKLTLAELRAIEALDLEPGSLIWTVRQVFLFSFFCAGIRFGDLAELRHENLSPEPDGQGLRLSFRMNKTGGLKSVRLLPQARAILDSFPKRDGSPYLFPLFDGYDLSAPRSRRSAQSSQTALANKYLKKIASLAGVTTKLSTHVARHSFADIARKAGWSIYDISKALGHANLKVTETYLRGFDADALDDKMATLFG